VDELLGDCINGYSGRTGRATSFRVEGAFDGELGQRWYGRLKVGLEMGGYRVLLQRVSREVASERFR